MEFQYHMLMENILKNKYHWRGIFLWSLFITIQFLVKYIYRPTNGQHSIGRNAEILSLLPFLFVILWGIFAGLRYTDRDVFLRTFAIIKNPFIALLAVIIFFHTSFSLWMAIFDHIENVSFIENLLHVYISFINVSVSIIAILFL